VRYAIDPREYFPGPETMGIVDIRDLGVDYTGAYWVSGLHVRDAQIEAAEAGLTPGGPDSSSTGYIDAASKALPGWDVSAEACGSSTGISTGGNPELTPETPTPNSWQCQRQVRGGDTSNALDLTVRNFDTATIDSAKAGLDGGAPVTLTARGDGPIALTLDGLSASASGPCLEGSSVQAGQTTLHLDLSGDSCEIVMG
jgi:hypothetical protein